MTELVTQLTPYALAGFYALVGVGGTVGYYRRNGNNNGTGQYVTRKEFLGAVETIRKEGREDRQVIFKKLDRLSGELGKFGLEVARIQGAHEKT